MKHLFSVVFFCVALFSFASTQGIAREADVSTPTPDLAYGAYQRGDFKAAMAEAKKRLQTNPKDPAALGLIGQLYMEGAGVSRDAKAAMDWFRRAADVGNGESAYIYGAALLQGLNVAKDRVRANFYLQKAAAQNHGAALHLLGEMELENDGRPSDFVKALDYFKRADALGEADASYALGVLYKTGKGVEKDLSQAAIYFKRAADLDLPAAMVEYAIMLFNGAVAPRDQAAAMTLLRRAAVRDNSVAQNRLAHIYAQGLGVPTDLPEARYWRDKARSGGLTDASLDFLSNIPAKKMTEEKSGPLLVQPKATMPTQQNPASSRPDLFSAPIKQ